MPGTANRVLVVDDEPPLLKMVSTYLRRLGYVVVAAGSTDQAWKEVEAAPHTFAIAVLDATMSGMSMEELAAQLLAIAPRLCVIAASGYPVDISQLEAGAPGRVMFLHKPFSPEMLGQAVRRMIATQKENL